MQRLDEDRSGCRSPAPGECRSPRQRPAAPAVVRSQPFPLYICNIAATETNLCSEVPQIRATGFTLRARARSAVVPELGGGVPALQSNDSEMLFFSASQTKLSLLLLAPSLHAGSSLQLLPVQSGSMAQVALRQLYHPTGCRYGCPDTCSFDTSSFEFAADSAGPHSTQTTCS